MTQKKKDNPQSKLSKELLANALLNLMEEKPYNQINITELSARADISRRTFYRHFSTIDDVLEYKLFELANQFILFKIDKNPMNLKSILTVYFTYWEQHKHFLLVLNNNNLLYLILQDFLPAVKRGLLNDNNSTTSSNIIEYTFSFSSGALWNILVKWLEDGGDLSTEELSNIIEEVVAHLAQ